MGGVMLSEDTLWSIATTLEGYAKSASSRPQARPRTGESRRTLSKPLSPFESKPMYNPPMQGIPWSTIALGSLLLISARSTGGQEVKSPQPEKSNPPVKMKQRGAILGIG